MSSSAQALFDPSKVGRKKPPPPEAGADGLFSDLRAPLGSRVNVLMGNVLTIRQAPAFDAPVVPICANADKHDGWVYQDRPFQIKAYADARLRIEQRGHPAREFDTLWAHLADTVGRGCEGWVRIDAPYVLEPHTGDYAASLLKHWNDRLHDESASAGATITLRSKVMLGLTPFREGNVFCGPGAEVVKTGEMRSDGPRVAYKVRVTKGDTPSCRTGSIGWLRGDAI